MAKRKRMQEEVKEVEQLHEDIVSVEVTKLEKKDKIDYLQRQIDAIKLKEGYCIFVEVDANGVESNPSTMTIKGFETQYGNNPNFKIKKK